MKKFTEKEYQKIVDCFDRLNNDYNMGFLNNNLVRNMQDELFDGFDFINDWPEIVSIANPRTREWAHDQFVEKEKAYYWRNKKLDDENNQLVLTNINNDGAIMLNWEDVEDIKCPLTESEIRDWGYNPDMFDREEVE